MMSAPTGELYVHCEGGLQPKEIRWLQGKVAPAIAEVLARYPESPLARLEEVEITLVDDEAIAQVHGEFMDDATATDVITFEHGEILVSVETAARQSCEFGKSERDETLMYLVHGLLHLAGLDDLTEADFAQMAKIQEEVWEVLTTD